MTFKLGIIGGGVSGLTTAYEALKVLPGAEIHVLEGHERLGGLIESSVHGRAVVEYGPDAFLNDRPWLSAWLRELGLENDIIGISADKRRSFIFRNGKVNPVPAGFYLISPTSFGSLLKTNIISWFGKIRMAMEYFIAPRRDSSDESVSSFIERRFGREALIKIGQPMIGGIYTADPSRLSMKAALPKFCKMEEEYGSLIKALAAQKNEAAEKEASGPRYRLFSSFRGGMQQLIDALTARLGKVKVRTDFFAQEVERRDSRWMVRSVSGQSLEFDALCAAVPAHKAAVLFKKNFPDLSSALDGISYESSVIINLFYEKKNLPPLPEGAGIVVPESEKRQVVGITFSSQKFEGRAPEGEVLVRVFMGGAFHRGLYDKSDTELVALAQKELKAILKIEAQPLWTHLRRYPKAMPQYEVGHPDRVRKIFDLAALEQGLFLTGNAYHGVGIPESIERACQTAQKIADFRKEKKRNLPFDHILIVGFGGPEKMEDVWPFLLEVTKGTRIPEERLKSVFHHYELVGGSSPYNRFTRDLAARIEISNSQKGIHLPVFIGMKNWHPFMRQTTAEIRERGFQKGLAVVLAPHRSDASWDKYLRCVDESLAAEDADVLYDYLEPWHGNSGYVNAQADEIKKVMAELSEEEKKGLHVVFCAHSIPVEMARRSSYVEEFGTTSRLIAENLNLHSWQIAYQSRSGNPRQPWLEPDVTAELAEIQKKGKTAVMVVPVGFWCDNVEVLFDLDIEAREEAKKLGLKFRRISTVAAHPDFSEMFSTMIAQKLEANVRL